ncbi:MAG: metallophosphoesterase [Alphaproteobacteria bacterium]|nr:metallophosphoesterase [Alphaproteobacteria bacterium]
MQLFVEMIAAIFGIVLKLVFAAVVMTAIFLSWGLGIEPGLLRVTATQIAAPSWQTYWSPLRIAVVSDLHVGSPHIDLKHLEFIVETVNAQKPDLVLLLGDYMADGYYESVPAETIAPVLGRLSARNGVFAILGEHDWRTGDTSVQDSLKRAGIRVLHNQAAPVRPAKGRRFWIVGLSDRASGERPNYGKAAKSIPRGEPVFVMMHNPVQIDQVPASVTASFAGHTHGGLVNIPYADQVKLVPADTDKSLARGLINIGRKNLFVSSGIGSNGIPLRLNLRPEIAIVTIKGGQ